MVNTFNSLKNVLQTLKKENNNNTIFVPLLLVLVTIPLSHALNSISIGILLLITLISFKKEHFSIQKNVFFPIVLYLLMAASFFWSIDKTSTLDALLKEIPLLLLPISFLLFKDLSTEQRQKLIKYFSYSIVVLVTYYLIRASIRYFILNDSRVFFYHGENNYDYGLVPKLLNAIHVSVFVAIAFFYFLVHKNKTKIDIFLLLLLFGFVVLLSSKNIIIVFSVLILVYFFFFSKASHKMRLRNLLVFGLALGLLFSYGKIKERFQAEFQNNTEKSINTNVISDLPSGVHNISINEAWTKEQFSPNDFFPGTAFRVYQFRMFLELIKENNIFFTGFGLNASKPKLIEKGIQYNVFLGNSSQEGYQTKNFHNQYIQNFAELGFFGFLIVIIMLFSNLRNAFILKDFVHFAFAILMISLFLTESFLWRQRGVVFFTLLYCLFNTFAKPTNPKTEQKTL
jgi:O-antigen ligase